MNKSKNTEAIHFLYDSVLNKKQFDKLSEIISPDYINPFGENGVNGFQKSIIELVKAFPDGQWKVEEIIADGNKVVVKQKFTGTHKNQFQDIQPTNKTVSVEGIATYEFTNYKIISSQVQTDRLTFLQQLGVLPIDITNLTNKKDNPDAVCFIDKFIVPKTSKKEFDERMKINRDFIKTLNGFIEDNAYQRSDENGNFIIVTVAIWESQEAIKKAKEAVQVKYQKEGFDMPGMLKRLGITIDRGIYKSIGV